MKRSILLIFVLTLVFASCEKDNTEQTPQAPQESVLDYFPLQVGNYWVYERSGCDSTWTDCTVISTDTCIIVGDMIFGDFIYYNIVGVNPVGQPTSEFIRDSLDYIIDNYGNIYFSNSDFENKLNEEFVTNGDGDTIFHWYYQMQKELYNIEVPNGNFDCMDNKMSFYRKVDDFEKELNTHQLYSKNVGPVFKQSMFAHSGSGFKQELVDYRIIPNNSITTP